MSTSAAAPSRPSVPPSGARVRRSTPTTWIALAVFAIVVVVMALTPWWGDASTENSLVRLLTLVALAQMWNLLAGYAGRVSIGQQAFVGLGAYSLVFFGNNHGVNVFVCVGIAGVVCALLAIPLAAIAFRLQGGYFAIGTWVIAEIVRQVIIQFDSLGGGTGTSLTAVSGIDIITRQRVTLWLALAIGAGSIIAVTLFLRSRLGLGLAAARDSAPAARALGVPVRRAELTAFVVAAAGCGIAGAIIYLNLLRVTPSDAFSVNWTAYMIFMVVIGGLGTIEGPIIGAGIFYLLQEQLSGSVSLIILGVIAIVVTVWLPGGIWGWVRRRWDLRLVPVSPRLGPSSDASGGASG
jgi:branched-chain amino acid transport system permease protein